MGRTAGAKTLTIAQRSKIKALAKRFSQRYTADRMGISKSIVAKVALEKRKVGRPSRSAMKRPGPIGFWTDKRLKKIRAVAKQGCTQLSAVTQKYLMRKCRIGCSVRCFSFGSSLLEVLLIWFYFCMSDEVCIVY